MRLEKRGAGAGDGGRHRGARRPRGPQPRARDRAPLRQGAARADADDRPRTRLRPGRAEPRAGAHDRRDPDRLDLLARCGASPTRSRRRASASAPTTTSSSLDITTDGSVDPRDAVAQAAEILIRQLAIFTDIEKIEGLGEAPEAEAEIPQARGMENFPIEELELGRAQLQLPEARRHRDDRRPRVEDGDRAGRDPELRQEVDRGGQGDPGRARTRRCARTEREAPQDREEARPRLGPSQGALREPDGRR